MSLTITFFLGLIITLIGVIPPGLLNMTTAKISLKEGHSRAIVFSSGVSTTVLAQTYIAVLFARYLSNHPDIIDILQRVAMVIFLLISIYYLFIAKEKTQSSNEINNNSKRNRFFFGMFLSSLNMFAIPFHAYITITLASLNLMDFEKTNIISYVAGAATGTFVMLYIYIFFFDKIKNQKLTSQKNMNLGIGIITGAVALITLINIIKEI
ncbi:MAG: LysE family transporter [Flavobacteriaceae bacterium]|nr:LysE family transporter [Flavobacteriaceae bacterium]